MTVRSCDTLCACLRVHIGTCDVRKRPAPVVLQLSRAFRRGAPPIPLSKAFVELEGCVSLKLAATMNLPFDSPYTGTAPSTHEKRKHDDNHDEEAPRTATFKHLTLTSEFESGETDD